MKAEKIMSLVGIDQSRSSAGLSLQILETTIITGIREKRLNVVIMDFQN